MTQNANASIVRSKPRVRDPHCAVCLITLLGRSRLRLETVASAIGPWVPQCETKDASLAEAEENPGSAPIAYAETFVATQSVGP